MTYVESPSGGLPGNILTLEDSDFEVSGYTWGSFSNATITGLSSAQAFTGNNSLAWSAATSADSQIATGAYPCVPNSGYDFSGLLWTGRTHDAYIGVQWLDSTGTAIGSPTWSQDFSTMSAWQPLNLAATSPVNAAQFKLLAWAGTNVAAGETFFIDLMYAAKTPVQILADWCNPVFFSQSKAGVGFFDLTPWVRFPDNVQMTRGRQSRISEVSAGSATFNLQNDDGWFTKYNSNSPIAANLGGVIDLGARCQINVADETGTWHTRFDGQVAEIDQNVEAVGTTAIATFVLADVLAYLNRQSSGLYCWTKSAVMSSGPWMHWTLDDTNNAGNLGVATETSGNNGPALHPVATSTPTSTASIGWGNNNGGVETQADASAPGQPDMWEFWKEGSDTPSSDVNGLESGVTGPYTTPLPSAYFTPVIPGSGGSAQNNFVTNAGYVLTGGLTKEVGLITPGNGSSYAVEAWYAMDPWIGSHAALNMGPYVVVSLGNSRSGSCLLLGVWNGSGHLTTQAMTYGQPPAFVQQQYGTAATQIANVGAEVASDKKALPHHILANITGADGGATLELFVDGASQGTITLPAGVVYDTVTIGGAHGGWGCFFGNIQLVSIYQRTLSGTEVQQHCNFGQYGMWESTTDNCIAQIAEFANLPPFWNSLTAQSNGLSLTDYYDITNLSPLSAMQVYERAEQGLLYVAANGAMTFATRDQRQGHGAPDLMLPPDTYTSGLGYQLIDQYILNQVSVNTQTYQRGVVWQNPGSNNQYGPYSNGSGSLFSSGPSGGPLGNRGASYGGPGSSTTAGASALPLITWSRAYAALGLPQYTNSPDPALNDLAAWQVNTQSESRQTYSSLTIDLLTLDPASGLSISQLYGLDINDVIGLSGVLPTSIANGALANEMFIEGVNEIIGLNQRTIELYTSPAAIQRAWIPGDPVYGVLGSTSRVGLSAADTSTIPAIGKDVAHDAGGPYWPPSFIVEDAGVYQFGYSNFTGTTSTIAGNFGLKSTYQGDTIVVQAMCPAASTVTVGPDSAGNTYLQVASAELPSTGAWQYVFASVNAAPLNSADTIPVTGSVSQNYVTSAFGLENVLAIDGSAVNSGTGTTSSVSTGNMSTGYDLEVVVDFNNASSPDAIPSGWNYALSNFGLGTLYNSIFWKQNQDSTVQTAPAEAPSGVSGDWNLTFDDEFSGASLDGTKWGIENAIVNNVQSLPSNVSVSNGSLALVLTNNNALTGQNANFEGGIGSWQADTNTTVALSTTESHSGSGSLAVTSVAAGNVTALCGPFQGTGSATSIPVSGGQQVLASAWLRAGTTGRSCRLQFDFFNGSTYVSTTQGTSVTDSTTGWTQATDGGSVYAPTGVDHVHLSFVAASTAAAGEVHYVDDVSFSAVTGASLTTASYALPVGSFVEARINFPGSAGDVLYNWPAFWTSGPSWPAAGENDIAEVSGWPGATSPGALSVNYHSPSGSHGETTSAISSKSWANEFHTYGLHRKAGSCDVYYDGVLVSSYSTDDNGGAQPILLTIGGTADVNSAYGAASTVLVDYVRAWEPSFSGETFSATHASTGWGAIALTFTMQPATLNNPSGSGNQFIGSLEMRGLHDTLMTALQPPMTIVGDMTHGQTVNSGNLTSPEIVWDQVFVDTAGGMSAIPGWQNWYACTVPGFYEINGCARMTHNTQGGTVAGYLAIASQAAQAVAAGTATPETIDAYVCPVGEQHQMNTNGIDLSMSASTRTYLGVGDMVALCMTQNTGAAQIAKPFSTMSIRWCGYSTVNDQVEFNSSLGAAGTVTSSPGPSGGAGGGGSGGSSTTTTKKTHQAVWGTTSNLAYWGTSSSFSPQLRSQNSTVYQGEYAGGEAAGSQFTLVVLNYSAIQSALSGATINWIKLTCKNEHFWYNSGGKLILGWSSRGPGWGNYYSPNGNDHMNAQQVGFGEGQQKTFYLGSWAKAIASSAKALIIGNNSTTDLQYYSFWSPSFVLTVNYTK